MGLLSLPPPTTNIGRGQAGVATIGTNFAVPTGVESVFEYNGLTLNDKSVLDTYRISRIEGLSDPDVRDSREPNPSRHGETAFAALYGGRTIVLNGRVEAFTLDMLRDMVMALKMAFGTLVEEPLNVLTGQGYDRDHLIYCRKSQSLAMTEEQTSFSFFRDFMITLRASDPRILSREKVTTPYTFSTSQAVGDALSPPVVNRGSFPSQPLIVLRGPMTSPQIGVTSWEGGAPLRLSSVLNAGEERWIDVANRRVYDQLGNARFSEFVLGSTWLELPPGSNLVTFAASGLTSESSLTFYHRHSWL